MYLLLAVLWAFQAAHGFRATLVVEEGDSTSRYHVDFKAGGIRVEPDDEGVQILIDVESGILTLLRAAERVYCRLDPASLRRFISLGAVDPQWFPWVCEVGPDLVHDLELRHVGDFRLPDGRRGRHWSAYSKRYDRVVAEYWLDPESSGELFFQWTEVYLDWWGEDDEEGDRAQEARLELYSRLKGLPVKMEERLNFLTRTRTLRLENRTALPADAFDIPKDYTEKTPAQLLWEDLVRRWVRPKSVDPVPK